MRNKRSIIIGALIAPMLALTGGLAYAATSGTGQGHPASHPAATATATPGSQHPASQVNHHGHQRNGSHRWCDNHRYGTRHHVYQGQSYQGNWGPRYRHHGSYQGNWGYQSRGSYGGYRWGSGNGCCRGSWR